MPKTMNRIFDDEQVLRDTDRRLQERLLQIFIPVFSAVEMGQGMYTVLHGYPIAGWVQFSTGIASILCGLLYLWHRRLDWTKIPFVLLGIVSIISHMTSGGIAGTANLWALTLAGPSFPFLGLRKAAIINLFFLGVLVAYLILVATGVDLYYTVPQMRELTIAATVLFGIAYATERGWARSRAAISLQRENLQVLLRNLPVGVLVLDPKGENVLAANAGIEEMLGRRPATGDDARAFLRSCGFHKEGGQPYPEAELPFHTALVGGTSTKNDIVVDGPNGSVTLRVIAAPLRGGDKNVIGIVMIMEDATKEREIDRMKSEFVAIASHQLKTPLTAVRWSTESLMSGDEGPLNPKQGEVVRQIAEVNVRLTTLVGELLEVSHIETGRKFDLNPAETDLVEIAESVAKEIGPVAGMRNVIVRIEAETRPLRAWVDPEKAREALLNLASNAVKYSKEGGVVRLRLLDGEGGMVAVEVRDEGVGIPEAAKNRVFEKFYRAPNVGEVEGTGLGLYIVRAIIERSGGRVWFDSEEGKGTVFHVLLPEHPPVAAK